MYKLKYYIVFKHHGKMLNMFNKKRHWKSWMYSVIALFFSLYIRLNASKMLIAVISSKENEIRKSFSTRLSIFMQLIWKCNFPSTDDSQTFQVLL